MLCFLVARIFTDGHCNSKQRIGQSRSHLRLCLYWRGFRPLPACAVHFVGGYRRLADALPPGSPVAAHRISSLGNPYGTASVAVSADVAGGLDRTPRRNRAVPRRVPAPLSGQPCISQYLRQCSHHCSGNRLRVKSGFSCSANMDWQALSSLTVFVVLPRTIPSGEGPPR